MQLQTQTVVDAAQQAAWLCAVEVPVNLSRDRLDLSAQLRLDAEEVVPVLVGDEVDRETEVPKAARATNPVQVRLCVLGEVKVDHHVH